MARASIKDILPPQPHYISGYSGFVQGYKFDCGQSYGRLTHSLFEHRQRSDNASRSLLANLYAERSVDGQVDGKAVEKRRCRNRECRYTSNMVPGYAGHVPQYNFQCGKKYPVDAFLGLLKFENIRSTCLCPTCEETRKYEKSKLQENIGNVTENIQTLQQVKGGMRRIREAYQRQLPMPPSETPYFLADDNPHKTFMAGYMGHVPYLRYTNGRTYGATANEALRSFTAQHERRKANARQPVDAADPTADTCAATAAVPFYQQLPYDAGIMKNYAGHIPGINFNVGQTTSAGSRNARAVLTGTY